MKKGTRGTYVVRGAIIDGKFCASTVGNKNSRLDRNMRLDRDGTWGGWVIRRVSACSQDEARQIAERR